MALKSVRPAIPAARAGLHLYPGQATVRAKFIAYALSGALHLGGKLQALKRCPGASHGPPRDGFAGCTMLVVASSRL